MLFNSFHFLLFFPVVTVIYFLLAHKYRWILLLAASFYFYMCWKAEYVILILITTFIDFYASILMSKTKEKSKRKKYLYISLISNFAILFGFKYFNFFNQSIRDIFNNFNLFYDFPLFDVLLPIGISFYTFQTLTYTIDVYEGKIQPINHYGIFCLFVTFFPHLVAGPIQRASYLIPQFYIKQHFDYKRITDGMKLMFWGFFQKIVIADNLSGFVTQLYNHPSNYYGFDIILITFFFAIQIYCDFSGYTDIGRGAAKVLGINFTGNFIRPYFAKSIADFWRRWHISLSTWFRDYLYIPLGGSKVVKWRWYYNIFITFFLSGLWHGANWTFIVWGSLFGLLYIIEIQIRNSKFKLSINNIAKHVHLNIRKIFQVIFIFSLVCLCWIFFRANSISDALILLKNIFTLNANSFQISFDKTGIILNCLLIAFLFIVHLIERKQTIVDYVSAKPFWIRWPVYYFMFLILIGFGNFGVEQFIYFQF